MSRVTQNPGLYPAWRHHKDGRSQVVHTLEHDESLGDEWADTLAEPESPTPAPETTEPPSEPNPTPAPKRKGGRPKKVSE